MAAGATVTGEPVAPRPGSGTPPGPGPVALVGPTATGKSALALEAAERTGTAEILSVDAMCVYREMDVATAKPSPAARTAVPHHLVDLVDPAEEYTVSRYQRDARQALAEVSGRGHRALFVGGTGLYLRAVVDDLSLPGRWPAVRAELETVAAQPGGLAELHARLAALDPAAASRVHPDNERRLVRALEVTIGSGRPFSSYGPGLEAYPPTTWTLLGLPFDADAVDRRIAERFQTWMADGLLDEVRRLAVRPAGLSRTARQALGYRELLAHVEGGVPLADCVDEAIRRTRRYARRQWSWFRRDPRIVWLAPGSGLVDATCDALGA